MIQICHLLNTKENEFLINDLPKTYQSPTMAPFCKDEVKYKVVDQLIKEVEELNKALKLTIN